MAQKGCKRRMGNLYGCAGYDDIWSGLIPLMDMATINAFMAYRYRKESSTIILLVDTLHTLKVCY